VKPRRLKLGALLLAMLGLLYLAGTAGYFFSERSGMAALRGAASHRLDLMAGVVGSDITRNEHVPGAVELNADVLALLRASPAERPRRQGGVNRYLEKLNHGIDALAVFVMATDGQVLASSDWIYSDNLLGQNLSFRPFFRAALQGTPSRHYAIDTIRNEAGYFFAQPIRDEAQNWRIVGVAVVKTGLGGLERKWSPGDAPALIADGNGVVILSSVAEWKYSALQPLSGEALSDLTQHQYNDRAIRPFPLDVDINAAEAGTLISFPSRKSLPANFAHGGQAFLAMSRHLPGTDWRLLIFSSLRPVYAQAATHAALAMAATACLLLAALYLGQRRRVQRQRLETQALLERANAELEQKVLARTADLTAANEQLQAEVAERERAEQTLRAAQDELVQAAKLAVLGQLATGITHELTQPLGALRTLSGNAAEFLRRGKAETAQANLEIIGKLVDQMGGIIEPLKTFARKSPARREPVDVAQVVASALFLLDQRLRRNRIEVRNGCAVGAAIASCEQNRLQQVLVNLIGNAADAMRDAPRRVLAIDAVVAEGRVAIRVADSGPGFSEQAAQHLFEPFFTTKPAGEGLGLGLAISQDIVREFGGELSAESSGNAGAVFIINLPQSSEEAT